MAEVVVDKPEATIAVLMTEQEAKNTAAYLGSRCSDGPPTMTLFGALADALDDAGISYKAEYQAIRAAQDEYVGQLAQARQKELAVPNPFELAPGKEVVLVAYIDPSVPLGQIGTVTAKNGMNTWRVEGIKTAEGHTARIFYTTELRVIG